MSDIQTDEKYNGNQVCFVLVLSGLLGNLTKYNRENEVYKIKQTMSKKDKKER